MSKNRVKKGSRMCQLLGLKWVDFFLLYMRHMRIYMHIYAHVENQRMASPTLYLLIS